MKTELYTAPTAQTDTLTVLCVDDDPCVADSTRRHLRKYNVEVLVALNGLQGMSIAMSAKPDLIITDVRMPLADGSDLIDCISSNQLLGHIPIIALTGAQEPNLKKNLEKLGAAAVLFKPIKPEALVKELQKFVPIVKRRR